jgi:hypothetical protein
MTFMQIEQILYDIVTGSPAWIKFCYNSLTLFV